MMLIKLDQSHNWRLRYHLQMPNGNMTDPNGLCYFKGEYHIFHQYIPRWPKQGGTGWGHWVSPDLVTWTFLQGAIMPACELDANGVYSGSSLVKDDEMWCYYTGNKLAKGDYDYDYAGRSANETLTISKDGRTFGERRLVLGNDGYPAYCSNHVRDPKVWWQDGAYHMLLGARTMDDRGHALMYRSDDALTWEMEGSATNKAEKAFGYMWECPNVVALDGREFLFCCPQGVPKQEYRFQNIHNAGYFPVEGTVIDAFATDTELMDAKGPNPYFDEEDFVELDFGFDFYAQQVFTDEKGRVIEIGWMGVADMEFEYDNPTREWTHTLTLPRVLTLNEAGNVCQWPAEEIDSLRGEAVEFKADNAHGSTGFLGSSHYDKFNMEGSIAATFADCGADVLIEGIEGEGRVMLNGDLQLVIHKDEADLIFNGHAGRFRTLRRMPLSVLSAGKIESLRVMVDTSAVEIYINGGEKTMTTRWYPLDIKKVNVSSTLKARHTGYEMGGFTFVNCG